MRQVALKQVIHEDITTCDFDQEILALANKIAKRHDPASLAILFYGSCLRDGVWRDQMLDFYLIVDRYENAYSKGWMVWANRLIPPNVFYTELGDARCKYAVLSLPDFEDACAGKHVSVSVWARFCQPSALLWSNSSDTTTKIVDAITQAHLTTARKALPLLDPKAPPSEIWPLALSLTYGAELRVERHGRAQEITQRQSERYTTITPLVMNALKPIKPMSRWRTRTGWWITQILGKLISILRLAKASFTFEGGPDYLAWKIKKHTGVTITLSKWQRDHPLLTGLWVLIFLKRRKAIR